MKLQQKLVVGILAALLVFTGIGMVSAQSIKTTIRHGVVVDVFGNNLVVTGQDGITRLFEIPDAFTFDVRGEQLPISRLQPGMILETTISILSQPRPVEVVSFKNGTVVKVVGNNLWVRQAADEGGKVQRYVVPGHYTIDMGNGTRIPATGLKPGIKLTATIVTITQEMEPLAATLAVSSESKPAPVAAPAPAPAPKTMPPAAPAPAVEEPPTELPSTGSMVPVLGLSGLSLLLAGLGLGIFRRYF